MIKLGPKLINAALSSNLLDIDWRMLESEVCLPRFHRVRTLDTDDLSSLLAVYKSMYGERITSVDCMANTVRRFGSVVIGPEKFSSKLDCRSLRSARIIASWTDHEGSISGCAGLTPGNVDCYIQHIVKMESERWPHVFALVNSQWSCGEVLVRGWRPELCKAPAIKHSSVSQGPFALRCAGFGVNLVAPSETCRSCNGVRPGRLAWRARIGATKGAVSRGV